MKTPFRFKQFAVGQSRAAMKVGTDGVLLGAWCTMETAGKILDVGTGTGLIALMAAQRNPTATVTAIEIDEEAGRDALENFQRSPWATRLFLIHSNIEHYRPGPVYDLIVSNPPYFTNALHPPDAKRTTARHTISLRPNEIAGWSRMLAPEGRIALILPVEPAKTLLPLMKAAGLHLHRMCSVKPTPEKPAHRCLLEFSLKAASQPEMTELIIEDAGRHGYSREYRQLTSNFYLKF